MPARRTADPLCVQHVWDAIRSANAQRQMADLDRIVKYLQRVDNCSQEQAELYVKQTLQDKLIVAVQKVSGKSTKIGMQVESYRIPSMESPPQPPEDSKDWYCIECHLAGDVTPCRSCHRVFHTECTTIACKKYNATKSTKINGVENWKFYNEPEPMNGINEASEDAKIDKIAKELKEMEQVVLNNNPQKLTNSEVPQDEVLNAQEYDKALCSVCNLYKRDVDVGLESGELNYLLTYVLARIRSWVPAAITDVMSPEPRAEWLVESELAWRAQHLFFLPMDMAIMDLKLRTQVYNRLCEFQADVITVQHNVAIFHGIESQEYGAADLMLRDCCYDMDELRNCPDCYKHSNEKANAKWFCLPCRNPHKLVWAKQKGYPYWPAKVIKETDDTFDVRFFGGKYERSVLPKSSIKSLATSIQNLQTKRTAAFNKAVEEFMLHQKFIENPEELQKLLTLSAKRMKKINKPQSELSLPAAKLPKITKRKNASVDSGDIYEFHDSPPEEEGNVMGRKSKAPNLGKAKTLPTKNTKTGLKKRVSKKLRKSSDSRSENETSKIEDDGHQFGISYDASHTEVSSSTEHIKSNDDCFTVRDNFDCPSDITYGEAVEKIKFKLEQCKDKKSLVKVALDSMQTEIDRITGEHAEYLKKLFEEHNSQISETKKKQWCYNCEQDAIYHCCWNTAYCSPTCQQQHWQAEHKKVCRRKR